MGRAFIVGGGVVFDFTLIDRVFIGIGGGVGFFGFFSPALHVRFGGYPIMRHGDNGIRRKGLMIALDLEVYAVAPHSASQDPDKTLVAVVPKLSIGYEAF